MFIMECHEIKGMLAKWALVEFISCNLYGEKEKMGTDDMFVACGVLCAA